MGRIIGLDFGAMTCGVAISDGLLITAQGIETIRRTHENKLRKTYQRIEYLIDWYEVDRIVVGLPKKLDGSEGDRAEKSRAFAADLERRTGLPVIMWDERFSTVSAAAVLSDANVRLDKKEKVIDKMAAVIILQNYLDFLANEKSKNAGNE
ncbi:MAG: Holliday junction resolvase RuvX [Lachnospiraceae bacterium]|nr:Holliday junction resolvase RuvX [Lachnospiraceae bacterium]MBR4144161.1 Holliday junction resolvase RuvX [Lachnospiraceae bacterium]MBR4781228.1 Holliday junction resolvase RuvX [Lachnospiraceae bacterium]MBR6475210.1 Holliday junction resolvase RuvX [Lachnospiraceae bacterium]